MYSRLCRLPSGGKRRRRLDVMRDKKVAVNNVGRGVNLILLVQLDFLNSSMRCSSLNSCSLTNCAGDEVICSFCLGHHGVGTTLCGVRPIPPGGKGHPSPCSTAPSGTFKVCNNCCGLAATGNVAWKV